MKRVKVDFSATVKDGLIRANQKRASEHLNIGDVVEAYDPGEKMEFEGTVDHLSDDGMFAFLRMHWEDAEPASFFQAAMNLVVTSLEGNFTAAVVDWAQPPTWSSIEVEPSQPIATATQSISIPA